MKSTKETLDLELHELVRGFLLSLGSRVEKIRLPLLNQNRDTARFAAHQLKGTAKSFGFSRIAELSDRLELAIGNGQATNVLSELLEQLDAAVKSESTSSRPAKG